MGRIKRHRAMHRQIPDFGIGKANAKTPTDGFRVVPAFGRIPRGREYDDPDIVSRLVPHRWHQNRYLGHVCRQEPEAEFHAGRRPAGRTVSELRSLGIGETLRRSLLVVVAVVALSVVALAAGDIPTRYSGSFPPDRQGRTNISGTFTGKTLNLRFTRVMSNRTIQRAMTTTCTEISPNQTRCTGRFLGVGGDSYNEPGYVIVTWSGGRPVATAFGH